jgi:hypothetical protein
MKTAASLLTAALTFAALAAPAGAKEKIKSAKICGASTCVTVTDREKASVLDGFDAPGRPPPASSFYTVEVTMGAARQIRSMFYYVPSAAMARPAERPGQAGPSLRLWSTVRPEAAALLREVTKGLAPFPRPQLSSVRIGSKTVVDGADSYLRLFELPSASGPGDVLAYSEPIDLRSAQPTPWTDTSADLSFSPSAGLLARGGQAVRIPEGVLTDLRAGRPLAADDVKPAGWPTAVAIAASVVASGGAVAYLLRRRLPGPRTSRFRQARSYRARGSE